MKIRTSEKLKFQIFSELISYVIPIYFDYEIEYFYREKPLHLNAVVQTPTSTNYYQGSIVLGQFSGGKSKCYLDVFLLKLSIFIVKTVIP